MKSLYRASIFHRRKKPKLNEFSYKGFYIRFDINKLEELKGSIFGLNRFNLFSFYEKDHGYRDQRSLESWAKSQLAKAKVEGCDRIELQTFPRVMGYVFNPVSFWFCFKKNEVLAVICEVNNTFGESHNYLIRGNQGELPKDFHVSPFFPVEGKYRFNFEHENQVVINYFQDDELSLETSIKGAAIEWSFKNFLKLFIQYPLYTFMVVVLIHLQAIKLWFKKATFYTLPKKKDKDLTYEYRH